MQVGYARNFNFYFIYLKYIYLFKFSLFIKNQTRTVQVKHLSDLAGEREIHEFFSFSGEIEHIEIQRYFVFILYF